MDEQRQQIWSTLIIFLLTGGIAYWALTALFGETQPPTSFEPAEEQALINEPPPEPTPPPSPAVRAAREVLADIPFERGSAGDKLYNLVTSEKTNYNRELYTFLHGFDPASERIPGDLRQELDQLATVLKAYPELSINLEIHTDNQGERSQLRQITQQQADSLKAHLVRQGIPASSIRADGFGPDVPLTANTSEAGRALNRRIEMSIRSY